MFIHEEKKTIYTCPHIGHWNEMLGRFYTECPNIRFKVMTFTLENSTPMTPSTPRGFGVGGSFLEGRRGIFTPVVFS